MEPAHTSSGADQLLSVPDSAASEIRHPLLATISLAVLALVLVTSIVLDWNGLLGTPARSWPKVAWFAAQMPPSPDAGDRVNGAIASSSPPTATPNPSPARPSIEIGWSSAHRGWIWITLNQFPAGSYRYTCNFSSGGRVTFVLNAATEPQTWDNGRTCVDTRRGDTIWVLINTVASNKIKVP
jgi:hypothetical protein